MSGALRACVSVNLKFMLRNRLPIILTLILLVMGLIGFLPVLVAQTAGRKLEVVKQLTSLLGGWVYILAPLLALVTISNQLHNRSLKLVVTKPCSRELWLFSNVCSALLVATVLLAAILALGLGLATAWRLPVHSALVYIALERWFQTMMLMSKFVLLAVLMHPVLAVVLTMIVSESLFYGLSLWTSAGLEAAGEGSPARAMLGVLNQACLAAYHVLPADAPFEAQSKEIHAALRVTAQHWDQLGWTALYAVCFLSFCYWLAAVALRAKRLT
jgi:hypothetical protein